ncbi:uncharacterized protein PHACADRAFT_189813 [Phanerochaete carnosa HHB-10118-sp]|uniref:Uncharacterized protein n=1 Tax=Phanerochaete carnosa (strain HHB-10118-sp) TaxID=650164 RepID=K5VCM1_PHACS|nr:uncharacterized protein PHACADRAFT_189813 [Phanerochaete carnosa HHB-10118-sp]EKM60691.1 hypothetical protein PHACADRAFT_189813 [Phanerochaete carnosa HHB-10118-sp]
MGIVSFFNANPKRICEGVGAFLISDCNTWGDWISMVEPPLLVPDSVSSLQCAFLPPNSKYESADSIKFRRLDWNSEPFERAYLKFPESWDELYQLMSFVLTPSNYAAYSLIGLLLINASLPEGKDPICDNLYHIMTKDLKVMIQSIIWGKPKWISFKRFRSKHLTVYNPKSKGKAKDNARDSTPEGAVFLGKSSNNQLGAEHANAMKIDSTAAAPMPGVLEVTANDPLCFKIAFIDYWEEYLNNNPNCFIS